LLEDVPKDGKPIREENKIAFYDSMIKNNDEL